MTHELGITLVDRDEDILLDVKVFGEEGALVTLSTPDDKLEIALDAEDVALLAHFLDKAANVEPPAENTVDFEPDFEVANTEAPGQVLEIPEFPEGCECSVCRQREIEEGF